MNCFPAEPGTWLVDHDPDVEPIPIVGWSVSGCVAAPVLPMGADPVSGQAYRLPGTGAVVDPAWSRTFESEEAWRASMDQAPYELGSSLLFGVEPKTTPASAKPKVTQTRSKAPSATDLALAAELEFGSKTLKNRSFWHYDGDEPFVFEIEGGKPLPENAEKIKRDDYHQMRKDMPCPMVDPDNLPESSEEDDADALV